MVYSTRRTSLTETTLGQPKSGVEIYLKKKSKPIQGQCNPGKALSRRRKGRT